MKKFFHISVDIWWRSEFDDLSAQARFAVIFFLFDPEYTAATGWKHLGRLLKIGVLEASLVLEELESAGLLRRENDRVVLTRLLELGRPIAPRPPRLPNKAWEDLRLQVFERDNRTCVYCGEKGDLECDHIVPVARGGSHEIDNLATACQRCNQSKGHKLLSEWHRLRNKAALTAVNGRVAE